MSSDGPYGRHGFSASNNGSYAESPGINVGYVTPGNPPYGSGYGGQSHSYGSSSYSTPNPKYNVNSASSWGQGSNKANAGSDEGKIKKKSIALQSLNKNVLMWAGFLSISVLVYYILSGGDFSFLMTLGAMFRMFGFGILNVKTFTSKRATGISAKSLELYSIVFLSRLSSIIRHEGYLPFDKSGDWLYHLIEILSFVFSASALYGCFELFKSTYQRDLDQFGEMNVPPGYGSIYLAGPVLLMAMLIHPNLNSDFLSDVAWTYAMYLESVALVPQLYMFQKQKNGVIELLTAHFVAALGFGRILEFAFWIYSYHELSMHGGSTLPGYLAIIAQLIQIIIMLDFFWYYTNAVKNATPLVLPSHTGVSIV